jgi:Flagellin and related hook-associated proteins
MSLNIYRNYAKNLGLESTALNRVSSGVRVDGSKDDPNAIAKADRLKMQIRGLSMAQRNLQDGVSMLQTFDSALSNTSDSLSRIKELMTQGNNSSLTDEDRKNIQMEINQLKHNINDLSNNTDFNGVKLIGDKSVANNLNPNYVETVVGANVGETAKIPTFDASASGLGINNIDINDPANNDISTIDSAIAAVGKMQSKYGALENRFDSYSSSVEQISDVEQKADSDLTDADTAKEMMEYSKDSILINAGLAMMAQSNNFPKQVLDALQRLR